MKKILLFATAMTALFATSSCSNEDNFINEEDNSGKTRIALSGTDGEMAVTRAGFTDPTRIVARIVSDKRGGTVTDTKCVTTVLSAKPEESSVGYSNVVYATGKTRYWDDAYGRNSILSVYAVAIPNISNGLEGTNLPDDVLKGAETWATANAADNTLEWTVDATQTATKLNNEDLTYSNNIQEGNVGANGVYTWNYTAGKYPDFTPSNAIKHGVDPNIDGRLYFTQSADYKATLNDGPGHFDKGQMEFKHALSRIQVNLKKGEGFDGAAFNVTSMQVLCQSVTGTFDIKTAVWTNPGSATAINMAKITTGASMAATYEAQMLPGYTFADNNTNAIQLTVDGNTYFIMNSQLRTALNGKTGVNASFSTEMGKRYIFTLEVAKNKIENITATVVDWTNVEAAEVALDNSHIHFTFSKPSGTGDVVIKNADYFNLYRYAQTLDKVYTSDTYTANPSADFTFTAENKATVTLMDGSEDHFTTNWFYDDNKTAYHLRLLNPTANAKINDDRKSFGMVAGDDFHWGAPMKTGATLKYDESTGYTSSLAKGILGADKTTEINITGLHMMSQLVVKLQSVAGAAAVNLEDAEVVVTNLYTKANVNIGIGKLSDWSEITNQDLNAQSAPNTNVYTNFVIPQSLVRSNAPLYVGLTIKTKDSEGNDANEYYVVADLSKIKADSNGGSLSQTVNDYITEWFPGHTYTYTFTLSKKQIENITATIANWLNVTAADTPLDLEK